MQKLQGKVCVITGGGSGIGRATSELFAIEGASVVVADINETAALETVSRLRPSNGDVLAVACDISREQNVKDLMTTTVEQFGRIDVLVNSAARFLYQGGFDAEVKDWEDVISTNLTGTALCSRYAAERMKNSSGGSILIVNSVNGIKPDAGYATYCSSKAALLMLAKCLAIDFGPWGIRVNSVCPGPVNTPALHRELERLRIGEQEFSDHLAHTQCLQGIVQAEDIARGILFLSSDEARMITGSNLMIDAGYSLGK